MIVILRQLLAAILSIAVPLAAASYIQCGTARNSNDRNIQRKTTR